MLSKVLRLMDGCAARAAKFGGAWMRSRRSPAREACYAPAAGPVVSEPLEGRRMFAVTAVVSFSQLIVTGTSGADNIKIYQKSATDEVTVYDGSNVVSGSPFSIFSYTVIIVNADAGNDTVKLGSTAYGTGTEVDATFDVPVADPAEIHGDAGNDTLSGSDHVDTIEGEAGTDTLNGAAGNDTLTGEEDADTINGDTGNDTIVAMDVNDGADVINGGVGTDIADYSLRSAALKITNDAIADDGIVDIDPGTPGNQSEGDKVQNDVEWQIGGDGNDSLNGGAGNDTLEGRGGNDTMYGSLGDDVLTGGLGADIMYGDGGNDTFHSTGDSNTVDYIYGGAGSSDNAVDRDAADSVTDVEILS